MKGYFNFSNVELAYDGMEAYQTLLHQKISMDFGVDDELELGRRSHKLSASALHDGELSFDYNLRNLADLTWSPGVDYSSFKYYIETSQRGDKTLFKIENSIEFIRGTKQNARFDLFYSIESYISPPFPFDNFHYKQIMSSSVLPDRIMVEESSVIGTNDRVYLFLPDELIPKFFDSSDDHKLNLTKIPLKINLHLELSNSDNKFGRMFKIESGFYKGSPKEKTDLSEDYQLCYQIHHLFLLLLVQEISSEK